MSDFLKFILIIFGLVLIPIAFIAGIVIFQSDSGDHYELYQQKIENSKKIILDYYVSYGRDGMKNGVTIIDSTEKIDFRKFNDLHFDYISQIPDNKTVNLTRLISAKNPDNIKLKPISTEKSKIGGIEININLCEFYKGASNISSGLYRYKFKSFLETEDSISFYGLKEIWKDKNLNHNYLKFPKGNIKLLENGQGYIYQIDIVELVKEDGIKYEIVNGEKQNQRKGIVVTTRTYNLIPIPDFRSSDFSDYGFFKLKK